jgi:hypothetical protein
LNKTSAEALESSITATKASIAADPTNLLNYWALYKYQYLYSKYVRGDNTPEHERYLGHLNAGELYPDFEPRAFESFIDELLAGKVQRPYENRS